MIEYGFRLIKIAIYRALTGGYPPGDVMKLVDYAVNDYNETGKISSVPLQPSIDDSTFNMIRRRALVKTVKRAYSNTHFYSQLAQANKIEISNNFQLDKLPVTSKENLRGKEEAFVDAESKTPVLSFSSTGTTAFPPTRVWMGRREMETLAATNALYQVSSGNLLPGDILVSAVSSRATLSNWVTVEACKRIRASMVHTGTIDPEECLQFLSRNYETEDGLKKPSRLTTYPSYLELLCETARRNGYAESDFGLKSINVVGEVLTERTAKQATNVFNATIAESYNISEAIQMLGAVCPAGNLHFIANGEVEVLKPETLEPVSEGEFGVLTFTPYRPPREVTLLVRYATGDIVKKLDGCSCGIRNTSVTSRPYGKFSKILSESHMTYRELFELAGKTNGVVHPLRIGCEIGAHGKLVVHVALEDEPRSAKELEHAMAERGVDAVVLPHRSGEHFEHYPLRAELIEPTFSAMMRTPKKLVSFVV